MKQLQKYDITLLILPYFLLLILGIVEVWSSSRYFSYINSGGDPNVIWKKELVFVVASIGSAFVASMIDYRWLKKLTPAIVGISLFLMLLLRLGVGTSIRGATRWIEIRAVYTIMFEPSQIAELALIIYIAYFISKKEHLKNSSNGIIPLATVVGVFFLLIAMEPDVGTAFLVFITFLTMIYIAGYRVSNILLLLFPSILALALIVHNHPEKLQRVINFFITNRINFQVKHSLIAIGAGGLFGHGPGAGNYKNLFIPDSYNDFILSGIGEDFGFIGIVLTILLLISIIFSIFKISMHSKDRFGQMLTLGIAVMLSFQSLMNIFSALNLMPPKGITMPFLSYGGSSLIVQGAMIGISISVCRWSCGEKTESSV